MSRSARDERREATIVRYVVSDALWGPEHVVPALARAGVDIDAMDEAGYTPLMYAATIDFGDTATLRALLAAGARPAIANPSGRTPLQQARRLGHLQLAEALSGR